MTADQAGRQAGAAAPPLFRPRHLAIVHLMIVAHEVQKSVERQHALPFTAEQVADALRPLNDAQRAPVEALLRGVVDSGLVAFDRIGSGGAEEQRDAREEYERLVLGKTAAGMSRFEAMRAVNRERPDLYAAQQQPKGGN